jgi:hypothetical protein
VAHEEKVARLVEQVGEEMAGQLLDGLVRVLASGERAFDEVYLFLISGDAGEPEGEADEASNAEADGPGAHAHGAQRHAGHPPGKRLFKFVHGPPPPWAFFVGTPGVPPGAGPGMKFKLRQGPSGPGGFQLHLNPGGRPNVVGFYARLYGQATEKETVLRLAEQQLSKTSFWRLKKLLGLDG